MKILVFIGAILAGCVSSDDAPTKVSSAQWKLCWSLCGKGDKLVAASPDSCLCKGGYRVSTEPQAEEIGDPEKPAEPFDLWQWLGFK